MSCFSGGMAIHELLQTLGDRVGGHASAKSVYGDPVTIGNRTVVPVACVRFGFGGGMGEQQGEKIGSGGGGGGGAMAYPAGALEITPEGTRFIPFANHRKMVLALALGFIVGAMVARRGRAK